ncbi:SLC5 family protein [Novosphingobium sp. PASSN1]|uniref:sodium:solute symporter family transporter n=1 Tax=Novosphingobium sp. PASSN1 TaxID=2015561 RepID=UPI0025CEF957|nr:SLC5 family protein [Novosphingobium sp. PASSN1]
MIVQLCVALLISALIGYATWAKVRSAHAAHDGSGRDVFLAGGGLSWLFVAGSITLTNLSTEQLVGNNGNQMLLLAWWELAGFIGLLILAFVFVPIYYRHGCTTVTELLDRRYQGGSVRTLVAGIFLVGSVLIYIPAALYSGSLFLKTMLGFEGSLLVFAAPMAAVAALYTILGGLRAVAVMDTYAGIGVLAIAMLVVVLALNAIGWDFSGVPADRLTLIGSNASPIPFHTLFTGMIFIQIFYWSTNQNITQKAMTAPTVQEAQRGVLAAAVVRILIIPLIVVVPGVAAFKLFGPLGDAAYGRIVAHVLPGWLIGSFAALMAAAVIAHTAAILNGAVALYSMDFHDRFIARISDHWKIATRATLAMAVIGVALVPMFQNAQNIINLLQQLNGLTSMPILAAFIVGLLFKGVRAEAASLAILFGVAFYGWLSFAPPAFLPGWFHYIDAMLVTLLACVGVALGVNRLIGARA